MAIRQHLTIVSTRFPLLALGVFLAKKGRRVLIVDTLPEISGPEEEVAEGYRFRKRPVPLFGLDDHGLLRRFLDEVGIGRMLINRTYPANKVSYQVVLPSNRINVYPEREKLFLELAREFPERMDSLREVYARWDGIAARWHSSQGDLSNLEKGWANPGGLVRLSKDYILALKAKNLSSGMGTGPEKDFLDVQAAFFGAYLPGSDLPPLSEALIQNIGKRGTFRDPAGAHALRTLLIQRFQEYGGKFLEKASIKGVENAPGKGLDLLLSDGSKVRTLLMAATEGIAPSIPGIPPRKKPAHLRNPLLRYPLRFYIGMNERFVPAGMEEDLFMMREDDGGPLRQKSLYLALNPPGSKEAPKGKRALTVTALVTEKVLSSFSQKLSKEVKEDLLQTLETVIPFISEGIDFISTDANSGRGFWIPRAVGGTLTSWSPSILGRTGVRATLKGKVLLLSPPPWELGLEGEILTALSAARILEKSMRGEG